MQYLHLLLFISCKGTYKRGGIKSWLKVVKGAKEVSLTEEKEVQHIHATQDVYTCTHRDGEREREFEVHSKKKYVTQVLMLTACHKSYCLLLQHVHDRAERRPFATGTVSEHSDPNVPASVDTHY